MKLINALRIIQERDKAKRKAEKEMRKNRAFLKHENMNKDKSNSINKQDIQEQRNLVHVQSIFPQDDIIALKMKTGEAHIREAISKAVYFYLKTAHDD